MQWIKSILLIVLGGLAGFWLAQPGAVAISADAIQSSAGIAATIVSSSAAVDAAQQQLPAVGASATETATKLVRDNQTEDIKLPAGLAWHPPKSLMPDFFVPDAKPFTADTYQQALQQLERADAELFEQLNQSLNGALVFDNQQNYQMLLSYGMPTIEELRYAYSKPVEQLGIELYQLISGMGEKYGGSYGLSPQAAVYHRLTALIKNRAADEMVAEYRQYNPNYQDGEPMPEQSDWPVALKEKRQQVTMFYAFVGSGTNMVDRIANFKLEQLIRAEPMSEQDKIVLLGMINPYNREFVSRYAAAHNLSETQRQLMLTVSNAAR